MNMSVLPVSLYILHAQGIYDHFQFCRKRKGIVRSAVVVILRVSHCLYFVTLLISMSFMNIDQCQRACARALRICRMHMEMITLGVTNRRDQQEARFIAFVVPFGQP